jgi:NADPH-dependent curcumin reductase CurA
LRHGAFGVQEFGISNGNGITKINAGAIPLPVFLGTLGMRGMTAYFGLLDIGQPKPGEP